MSNNCRINVSVATLRHFDELYRIGKNTPEFIVSSSELFMEPDEFKWHILNPNGIFLFAEINGGIEGEIVGFIYAHSKDFNKNVKNKYACIVYLVVKPEFRKHGVAKKLYSDCEKKLKELKITNLYGWAHAETDGAILNFMTKQGYSPGHKYIWIDKQINEKRCSDCRHYLGVFGCKDISCGHIRPTDPANEHCEDRFEQRKVKP